ncbi:MAG TPA: HEAT repeat domain-containing protein [Chthoniobacteraceae bacterium]|nr:HEAT repeat domain-containing protein [Chthoniobacteraceae bacterium]
MNVKSFFPPTGIVMAALAVFFWPAAPACAQDASPAPVEKIDPHEIEVTLMPDKDMIMPGEPLYATLAIKNNSKRTLFMWISDDWIDDKKLKPRNLKLTVTSKDGTKLPEFNFEKSRGAGTNEEGQYRPERMPPGDEYDFRVFVPYWAELKQPGSYTLGVSAKLVFSIAPRGALNAPASELLTPTMLYRRPRGLMGRDDRPAVVDADDSAIAVPLSAISALVVAPFDQKKMDDVTDGLLKTVAEGENVNLETREAGKKLLFIDDERAIPWLAHKFEIDDPKTGTGADANLPSNRWDAGGKYGAQMDALLALVKFNNDAALETLKKGIATKQTGNDEMWFRMAAAHYLLQSAHPGAISYLITYIHDPDVSIRNAVLEAMDTRMPSGEALPLVKEMAANDPSDQVRSWAKSYLKRMEEIERLKKLGLPTPTPYPER